MVVQLAEQPGAAHGEGALAAVSDDEPTRARRLRNSLELVIPAGFLVLMVLACFVWPEIYPLRSPVEGDLTQTLLPALSPHFLLGTDQYGNDILSRILYGGRVSIEVGLGTVSIGMVIGGSLGALAALKGGTLEILVMRALEVFLALPSLVLAIVVATYLGPSELHVIWAISFFSIPAFARLSRANTLRMRDQPFMISARLAGTRDSRILIRHVAPSIVPPLMTYALLGIGVAIMVEAALSFLGLGVPPPGPSWGNMIAAGQQNLATDPDLLLVPSAFLFATVLSLNLMGDALRSRWSVR
jgi:peptide/nickel transport system permease protein